MLKTTECLKCQTSGIEYIRRHFFSTNLFKLCRTCVSSSPQLMDTHTVCIDCVLFGRTPLEIVKMSCIGQVCNQCNQVSLQIHHVDAFMTYAAIWNRRMQFTIEASLYKYHLICNQCIVTVSQTKLPIVRIRKLGRLIKCSMCDQYPLVSPPKLQEILIDNFSDIANENLPETLLYSLKELKCIYNK